MDPTKLTAFTSGWASSRSTATLSPFTRFSTPGGNPAWPNSSATKRGADGSRSDGLSTKALPQATALGIIHSGTMAGKLNGVMPTTTPRGWRTEWTSTPVEARAL